MRSEQQKCDSSVPTTAPAVATEKEWTLTLTEHAFVIGGAGIKPIWFERRGNQNREQLESLVAAHNSALGSETQMPMGVASEETDYEYLCCDGHWRPCTKSGAMIGSAVGILANGVHHYVPPGNVRPVSARATQSVLSGEKENQPAPATEIARKYAEKFRRYQNSWEKDCPSQRELERIIRRAIRESSQGKN